MNIFNRCLSHAESITKFAYEPSFSQNILSQLSATQKKIAAVACIALTLLTAILIAYRCCFATKNSTPPPSPYMERRPVLRQDFSKPGKSSPDVYKPQSTIDDSKSGSRHFDDFKPFDRDDLQRGSEKLDDYFKPANDPYGFKPSSSSPVSTKKSSFDDKDVWGKQQQHSSFNNDDYVFDDDPNAILKAIQRQSNGQSSPLSSPVITKDPLKGYQPPIFPIITPQNPQVDPLAKQGFGVNVDDPQLSPKLKKNGEPRQDPVHHDPILAPLFEAEKKINQIKETLHEEVQILQIMQLEADGQAVDGLFSDQEEKIKQLNDQLKLALKDYPGILGEYLINRFNQSYGNKKDHQEIYEHVAKLTGHMQNNSDNHAFIRDGLSQIDLFLTKCFFTSPTESCLQEEKKVDLIVFQEFFTIVNEHYPFVQKEDPNLAQRLRIKLANLPLEDYLDRTKFQNIYLSEADQRLILIDHFQAQENAAVDQAIVQFKTKSLTEAEVKQLSNLVSTHKNRLSPSNLTKLQNALKDHLGNRAPSVWNDKQQVFMALKQFFNPGYGYNQGYNYYNDTPQEGISALHKANKVRRYLEKQSSVPRWYHTTKLEFLKLIIEKGEIEVRHQQMYPGAWVSTTREPTITLGGGTAVLIFNHDITLINADVLIGFEKGQEKKRWRGLQKAIPMCKAIVPGQSNSRPNLALVGLGEGATKSDKQRVIKLLSDKGIVNPTFFTGQEIDYMQKQILLVIGDPNLPANWWGKADGKGLDKVVLQ